MLKRKLNGNDVPEEAQEQNLPTKLSFEDLHLDARLLQAIAKENYAAPTPVQIKAIPLALEGRDVLARAKTGSGKTAAYILPILQSILKRKAQSSKSKHTTALILVPTRELASQITKVIATFTTFCFKDVQAVDLTQQISDQAQKALLVSAPDIVVATPSRASAHLDASTLVVDRLAHLVIDEADLVLSYEYGDDFDNIVKLIPQGVQTFLASATLTTEVDTLRGLFCRDPFVLDLQEEEKGSSSLSQYVVKCAEDEKFLLLFAVFKLKLVKGKCIVFVGDVDRCYRVRLYLEQFGIKSCVLNSELPINCRVHVVEEFNKGVYDIIIATDEHELFGDEESRPLEETKPFNPDAEADSNSKSLQNGGGDQNLAKDSTQHATTKASRTPAKKRRRKDHNYGISRGVDFHAVNCVLNFDLPQSAKSYTHRIGRTARAGRTGIALSFIIPSNLYRKHKPTTHPCTANDETVLAKITASQEEKGQSVQAYHFDMKKLEGFKYRVSSALKSVTPGAIREARIRELRQEMLKSEKLKRHLDENPQDLRYLRHDTELRPAKIQPHLKHVPEYLMPAGAGSGASAAATSSLLGQGTFVGLAKTDDNRIRKARDRHRFRGKKKGAAGSKKVDPLKTFNKKKR